MGLFMDAILTNDEDDAGSLGRLPVYDSNCRM